MPAATREWSHNAPDKSDLWRVVKVYVVARGFTPPCWLEVETTQAGPDETLTDLRWRKAKEWNQPEREILLRVWIA